MDMKISSTIGFERRHNPTLAIRDEDEFVAAALAGLGPQPPNFEAIVELNRGPLQTEGVELLPLAPRQVEQLARHALLVDVRTDQQFDDAHLPGAVAIPMLHAGFGSRLAWLADRNQQIVFAGRDDEDGRRAGKLAVAVGIRRLAGFLHGGVTAWRQERRPVARIERLALADLPERAGDLQILDVRERSEWDEGHIPGSLFAPWHDLHGLPSGLDPARPVAVMCASGQRAAVAASLLQRLGAEHVIHVVEGGVPAWGRLGHPLERST
jgi:hydroxyacylglutathione hydrolase